MKTRLTILAALLLAGASQAALAQEHDHDRWVEPGQSRAAAPQAAPAPVTPPANVVIRPPQSIPGVGRWGGDQPRPNGGDRARFQPQAPVAQPAPQLAPQPGARGDRRDGQRNWGRDRNGFAPGGTANGDRRWDRRDAPREVVPPGPNAERGWDRDHDGHQPGRQAWDRRYDGRRPPANWQRWDRNRFPPVYAAQRRFHIAPYHRPYGWFVRSWAFGDFLPGGWFAPDYWIEDFWDYDLPYPPPGYHWVRVGDDALLVDDYRGRVVQVVRDIFW